MLHVKPETIRKQYNAWVGEYETNNHRGHEAIVFGLAGEQWAGDVASDRFANNKETLTFNLCSKHLRRLKSQSKEIEFWLSISPTTAAYQENIEQTQAFRLLLSAIMLSDDVLSKISLGLDKCVDFGYSFYEVNYQRENDHTLCLIPTLRVHHDQRIAFWDLRAKRPTKIDGRFCGIRRQISRPELLEAYPKFRGKDSWLAEENNEVIDYWYRDYHKEKFFLLEGGVFKREELLTPDDMLLIQNDDEGNPIFQEQDICCIYFKRICNDRVIEKPRRFPTDDLPLIYHFALTIRTKDGQRTYPYIYSMEGAQKLHNYVMSQIATMAKNATGDKWFFTPAHVRTEQAQLYARQINMREGGFVFEADPTGAKIQREAATEIPASMMNLAGITKQEIDEISGAMIDTQRAQQAVISGEAIDRITNNIDILQVPILAAHIEVVNDIGRLYRQMIPRIYTETRTLVVKQDNGDSEPLIINEVLPTDDIKNNVREIENNFHYEIKSGPCSVMVKENTRKALLSMYNIDPSSFALTADIFIDTLQIPRQEELARRLATRIDPMLIAYSQGKATRKEFDTYQQQQAQQRQQAMMSSPEAQIGQAEMHKAKVQQFEAETKRNTAMADAVNDQAKLALEYAKLESLNNERAEKAAVEIDEQLRENMQLIDQFMNGNNNANNIESD